jgi:aminopeptidase 2
MFAKWVKGDDTAIFPDLRGAVFAMAIKYGGKTEWEAVHKVATDATASADERNTALRSLGHTRDPELIQRTLYLALNEVKEQDIHIPLQGYPSPHLSRFTFLVSVIPLKGFVHCGYSVKRIGIQL